jgi:preprotein translocase subunit SecF
MKMEQQNIEDKETKQKFSEKFAKFHDKNYKLLLLIPIALLIFGFVYMGFFYSQNHDFIHKDISLAGGVSITINVIDKPINIDDLKNAISSKLENVNIREISNLITNKQEAVVVEVKLESCNESQIDTVKNILENYLGYQLVEGENSSIECIGSTLGENFYQQLLIALLIAFVLMALVVFVQFKTFVPSGAVILSAFADIFMTLVIVNMLGIQVSSAGIVAFLMLIGYSVDTDILLTNKVLKREGKSLNKKLFESFKTGITMTLTSLFAIVAALIIVGSFSSVLYQIFLILSIGLGFDLMNTWITNVSIIKWYVQKKKHEN